MNIPFFLLDNKMAVYRYSVLYTEDGESCEDGFTTRADAEAFAEQVNGTVTHLDTTDYEWMDGIVIEGPTTNPMIQALEIYHMGREAWEAKQAAPSAEDRMAQMEADIAYLAMLTDTDMEV